jgi:26S proteasome regulatory subunit T3
LPWEVVSPYRIQTANRKNALPDMADAAVENPANTALPHKKQLPSSIPNFDTLEGFSTDGNDDYSTFKKLQRQLE